MEVAEAVANEVRVRRYVREALAEFFMSPYSPEAAIPLRGELADNPELVREEILAGITRLQKIAGLELL